MPSKKNDKARTRRNPRGTGPRASQGAPGLAGDVPSRQRVDYYTASIVPPRPSGQLSFRQVAPIQTYQVSASAGTAPVLTFALNGIGGSATFATLFDLYRLDAVRVTVRPNNNAIGMADPTTTALVPMYWVIDYNNASALTTAAGALEYDNCMVLSPGEAGERLFKPHYNLVVQSASGTDYVNTSGDWLNTSSDDIIHYGCKFWIPQAVATQTFLQSWTVEVQYYLTFRQVS